MTATRDSLPSICLAVPGCGGDGGDDVVMVEMMVVVVMVVVMLKVNTRS